MTLEEFIEMQGVSDYLPRNGGGYKAPCHRCGPDCKSKQNQKRRCLWATEDDKAVRLYCHRCGWNPFALKSDTSPSPRRNPTNVRDLYK